jgi:Ca2+-binding EF-hand superfamily protein
VIEERLKKLEAKIKEKFQNCFESVRKAFLTLDGDHDGYITLEDILKYFATDTDFNYRDLTKLIGAKTENGKGYLSYTDFSKWLGTSIHLSEGFYFRHDSIKNPQLDKHLEVQEKLKGDDKKIAAQEMQAGDIEARIIDKIRVQWKTLRKAFMDLNIEKTGKISTRELKFYLNFWGITITEKEFEDVFRRFDLDGDGVISYKDFQESIGSEMFPSEGLYFRQDVPQQSKIIICQHEECF